MKLKNIIFFATIAILVILTFVFVNKEINLKNWPRANATVSESISKPQGRGVDIYQVRVAYEVDNKVYSPTKPQAVPFEYPKGAPIVIAYDSDSPGDYIIPPQDGDNNSRIGTILAMILTYGFFLALAFWTRPKSLKLWAPLPKNRKKL